MLLQASKLNKSFTVGVGADRRTKIAASDVSIEVAAGDFVAIVGESGSGKSTTARMMLDLMRPDSGTVSWNGQDVRWMSRDDQKRYRAEVQVVFQDPSGAMNPRKRIRTILGEVIKFYKAAETKADILDYARSVLQLVGLDPADAYLDRFPHELSGGQRQRILIARAMIPNPKVIIADEAVSALDVSIKSDILRLMLDLRERKGVGYLLISHDLPVVRKVAKYVYVMRSGKVVEEGETEKLFQSPAADYTRNLLDSALDLDTVLHDRAKRQAHVLSV